MKSEPMHFDSFEDMLNFVNQRYQAEELKEYVPNEEPKEEKGEADVLQTD